MKSHFENARSYGIDDRLDRYDSIAGGNEPVRVEYETPGGNDTTLTAGLIMSGGANGGHRVALADLDDPYVTFMVERDGTITACRLPYPDADIGVASHVRFTGDESTLTPSTAVTEEPQ